MSGRQASLPVRRDPELQAVLDRMLDRGLASAAVALFGDAAGIERYAAAGRTRLEGGRSVRAGDRFDLASLTKPFTASLALVLDERGRLPLETRLGDIWDDLPGRLGRRSLEALLRHRSGLRPWTPLYRRARTVEGAVRHLLSEKAQTTCLERYGDLDYILWGLSAERALGKPYEALLRRHLLAPLGVRGVRSSPGPSSSVVECGLGNEREVELAREQGVAVGARRRPAVGSAQDGNADFLGGIAGHAGLFGSALDLWRLAGEWLSPGRVLAARSVRGALVGGRRYGLGWQRRTLTGSSGAALGSSAYGHLGYTGGSLWIDPRRDAIMVLLAHRTSSEADLKPWRRRFHRMVLG